MAIILEAETETFLARLSDELKKLDVVEPPTWASIVKTGPGKQRPPADKDWWYARAASVLRTVSIRGPVGVNKLRVKYGNKANMGMAPERFVRASGNIIRKILQQLEKAVLIKQAVVKNHKGRVMSTKGQSMLDKLATELKKSAPKPDITPKVEAPKPVAKAPAKEAPKPEAKEAPKEEKKEAPKEKKEPVKEEKAPDKKEPEAQK